MTVKRSPLVIMLESAYYLEQYAVEIRCSHIVSGNSTELWADHEAEAEYRDIRQLVNELRKLAKEPPQ